MKIKGLEYIKNSNGQSIKEMFITDFQPIGETLWNDLIKNNYIYEDEYGLLFLTPKGYEMLDLKVIPYKDNLGYLLTNCPYGYIHSYRKIPKLGSNTCSKCEFFEENNSDKNYVICNIESKKSSVKVSKIINNIEGKSGTSGCSGINGYGRVTGTSGYGSVTGVWIDESPNLSQQWKDSLNMKGDLGSGEEYILLNDKGERSW